jgi:hypothetical protein
MAFLWYLTSLNWTPVVRKYYKTDYIKVVHQDPPTATSNVRLELELDDNESKNLAPELYEYQKVSRASGFAPGRVKRVSVEIRRKHRGSQYIQRVPLRIANGRALQALLLHRAENDVLIH